MTIKKDEVVTMSPKKNEIQFTVNLASDVLERLMDMAKHAGISRHKLIVNIIKTGVEEFEVLRHVGFFHLGMLIRSMKETPDQAKRRKSGEVNTSGMPIPLRIDKNIIERLGRLAEKGELNRQRMAQNIIVIGLEELESARKYKLTDIALKIRDMHDLFKDVLALGERAFESGKEVKSK
jgi:hypothetical protein